MRFFIDDLEVIFHHPFVYPEQLQYMHALKKSLGKGHALLEMPTGTGKTATLLALLLAYQHKYPEVGKLVYCTRTVHEMNKVLSELNSISDFRKAEILKDQISFTERYPDVARITCELLNEVGIQAQDMAREELFRRQQQEDGAVKDQSGNMNDGGIDDDPLLSQRNRPQRIGAVKDEVGGGQNGQHFSNSTSSSLTNSTNSTNSASTLTNSANSTSSTATTTPQTPSKPQRKNPFKKVITQIKPSDPNSFANTAGAISSRAQTMGDDIEIEEDLFQAGPVQFWGPNAQNAQNRQNALKNGQNGQNSQNSQNSRLKMEPGQIGFDYNSLNTPQDLNQVPIMDPLGGISGLGPVKQEESGTLSTYNQNRLQQGTSQPLSVTTGPGMRSYIINRTTELLVQQYGVDLGVAREAVQVLRSPDVLGLCLSARTNMCINDSIIGVNTHREFVDTSCRNKTANYVREMKLGQLHRRVRERRGYTGQNGQNYGQNSQFGHNFGNGNENAMMDDIDTGETVPGLLGPGEEEMGPRTTAMTITATTTTTTTTAANHTHAPCGTSTSNACGDCPATNSVQNTQNTQNTQNAQNGSNSSQNGHFSQNSQNLSSLTSHQNPNKISLGIAEIEDIGLCPFYEGFLSVTNNRSQGYQKLQTGSLNQNDQNDQQEANPLHNSHLSGAPQSNFTDAISLNVIPSQSQHSQNSQNDQNSAQNAQNTQNNHILPSKGVFDINQLISIGTRSNVCPYYMTRFLLQTANVIVYNYHYMLDPKVKSIADPHLEAESIIVFDEAHNIDNICIEALSLTISKNDVYTATKALETLREKVDQVQNNNAQLLIDEYNTIVSEIQRQQRTHSSNPTANAGHSGRAPGAPSRARSRRQEEEFSEFVASPVIIPQDFIKQAIPGSIRKAQGFLLFFKSFLEFLKTQLVMNSARELQPKAFLEVYKQELGLHDITACKFAYDRLTLLLSTLNITDFDRYASVTKIASFITSVATNEEGFVVLYEPVDDLGVSDPRILLTCVDASIAIRPLFNKYASVVITSGTLSPLDMYPKMLDFSPFVAQQFTMSLNRNVVVPLIITKGNDQQPISTAYSYRDDDNVMNHYGQLLLSLVKNVPDGIVAFFPSYAYMENILLWWSEAKPDPKTGAPKETIISQILRHKLIFVETKDVASTALADTAYKKACDSGRGAIFFSIARGKVSEGVDFNGHYGRAVVMIGVPYQYTRSRTLLARLDYLRNALEIPEAEYLNFDALRQTSQCLGRIVRSKKDYGLMILADTRYNRSDIRGKLPRWIQNFIKMGENTSLSVESGVAQVKGFLREMSTEHDIRYDYGTVLLNEQQAQQHIERLE